MPRWTYLWPGLAPLWWRGAWWGLAIALAFATLLDVALLATLLWTEWLGHDVLAALWGAIGVVWLGSAWHSRRWGAAWVTFSSPKSEKRQEEADRLFREAQSEYLCGNWLAAEKLLGRLIGRNARDVDARLMLATLKRHTSRFDDASEQLTRLARIEDAGKWEPEIAREQALLEAAQALPATETAKQEMAEAEQAEAACE